jgi:hypothetical protein
MTTKLFDNDDGAYFEWLAGHPTGFVVNGRQEFDRDYLVLHRASCGSVNVHRGMKDEPGGFTERNFVKYCADSIEDLEAYLNKLAGRSQSFSKECSLCKPR